jgi:hypothetical protein
MHDGHTGSYSVTSKKSFKTAPKVQGYSGLYVELALGLHSSTTEHGLGPQQKLAMVA